MAGYAADPVNTALGQLRRGRDGPAVRRAAGRADVRPHLQLPLRPGRPVRRRAGRPGPRPGWSSAPGPPSSRARTGSGSPSRAPAPGSGGPSASTRWSSGRPRDWRWPGSTAGAGSSTRPVGRCAPGPGPAPRSGSSTTDGRLVELVHERGRRVLIDWHRDGRTGSSRVVRLRRAARRLPLRRRRPAGRRPPGRPGRAATTCDEAGRIASVTDADGVVELVNTYDDARPGAAPSAPRSAGWSPSATSRTATTVVADDSAGPTQHLPARPEPAGCSPLTDGHGHTLRKRYDEWGNPVEIVERGGAVTRQEFDRPRAPGAPRDAVRSGVHESPGTTPTGWSSITAAGSARTRFYLRGRRAHPVGDRRPGGRGHPAARGRRAGARPSPTPTASPSGCATTPTATWSRPSTPPAGWPGSSATPAGLPDRGDHPGRAAHRAASTTRAGCWSSAATRPAACGATSTAPRAGATAVVDPTGARTETRYGPHGEAAELVDALGAVTTQGYDVFGNLADRHRRRTGPSGRSATTRCPG